jgi:hypothetical protein
MADRVELSESQEQALIELYQTSLPSAKAVGKEFGISHNIVRRILKKHGVLRVNPVRRQYTSNEAFFSSISTESKAYWLGFLYADGCVTRNNVVELFLCETDADHLEKLRTALESSHPIKVYPNPGSPRSRVAYCLRSQQLHDDLIKLGCIPRKTQCLTFPGEELVPSQLRHHFMRGYFDGDGSVYGHTQKYKVVDGSEHFHVAPYFNVTGHRDFLEAYLDHLGVTTATKVYSESRGKKAASIKLGGRRLVNSVFQFLYRDATIFMDRKHNKFVELLRI